MKIADRYVQQAALGIGGMGEIWEGTDDRLHRRIAIKLIRPDLDDGSAARRFYREARILARLRHPGIPALYDFGSHDDVLYIVMKLVTGATLRDLVSERDPDPVPVPWAALIGAQFCAALAAAHDAGLVHRDLTPSNVFPPPAPDAVHSFGRVWENPHHVRRDRYLGAFFDHSIG